MDPVIREVMPVEKMNLGATIPAYPMPVSLVGALVEGKPNFLAVAWFSMVSFKPPRMAVSLGKIHYTNPGIKANEIFIGDIVGTYTDERFLTEGRLDFKKMKPVILSQPDMSYWGLGAPVAKAWSIGKKYKEKLNQDQGFSPE